MISTSTFSKSKLGGHLSALSPEWKNALGVFLVSRIWFFLWTILIAAIIPVAIQNLNLFGSRVLAAFDVASGERFAYSSDVGGLVLTFRAAAPGSAVDLQTGSVWSLQDGQAISGAYSGHSLQPSPYTVEDIYPYHGVTPETNLLLSVWQRFDTNWYLKIAEKGYSAADGSSVYFPLYPIAIRLVGILVSGRDLLAAIIVSNLALMGALYLLYKMSGNVIGGARARLALVYLMVFPTSFFLLAAYTESLFLCLSLASLYAGQRGRWLTAGVLGAAAALTRLQGALLILPLAYLWWKQLRAGIGQQAKAKSESASRRQFAARGTALLFIPLATCAFLAATNLSLLPSYESELHAQFVMPWDNLIAAIALIGQGRGTAPDVLNLLATIGFGFMSVVVWRKLPREYGLYTASMFLAPIFRMTTQQPLVSMTRYVLVLFPVFIVAAAWGKNPWVNRAVIYLTLPLNLFLSAQFFLWGWVA
jgi:Mannosyltransferase (PIG-V)